MSLEDSIKGLNNDKKSNDKSKLEGSTGEPPYEQFENVGMVKIISANGKM